MQIFTKSEKAEILRQVKSQIDLDKIKQPEIPLWFDGYSKNFVEVVLKKDLSISSEATRKALVKVNLIKHKGSTSNERNWTTFYDEFMHNICGEYLKAVRSQRLVNIKVGRTNYEIKESAIFKFLKLLKIKY